MTTCESCHREVDEVCPDGYCKNCHISVNKNGKYKMISIYGIKCQRKMYLNSIKTILYIIIKMVIATHIIKGKIDRNIWKDKDKEYIKENKIRNRLNISPTFIASSKKKTSPSVF